MIKALQYSSHMPVLVKAIQMTDGPVLEMGTGHYSTPLIHWLCVPNGRRVLSLESNSTFMNVSREFEGPLHEVKLVKSWDKAPIDGKWFDVALVDHEPALRRREDIPRLMHHVKLIVLHDTSPSQNHSFQYDELWGLFKYVYHHHSIFPGTSVLSNFIDFEKML